VTAYLTLQHIPITKSDYTFQIKRNSGYEVTDNFKLQDIPVMKTDYLFQIKRNSDYEEWLHIENYMTPRFWRVTSSSHYLPLLVINFSHLDRLL
jgi:hypothetical protein